MIQAMLAVGKQAGTGFNRHLAESRQAVSQIRETHGCSAVELLESFGGIGPDVLLAHCVWLDEKDIGILGRSATRVSHNPVSDQYLAAGVAPVTGMLAGGMVVALGTDGAVSNNNLDMFGVMKSCGLLQKVITGDAAAVPAEKIVAMATTDGARTLNLSDEIGSLEVGKKADLIAVSIDRPEMVPLHRVYESLVYSARAGAGETVIVDGQVLMEQGRAASMQPDKVLSKARAAAERLVAAIA